MRWFFIEVKTSLDDSKNLFLSHPESIFAQIAKGQFVAWKVNEIWDEPTIQQLPNPMNA